ncbi:MAG: hypothetical protein EBU84_12630, partial [Actinobacteria bacterium]|nr:hypothetical protein [Actinomycetota bacterium]
MGFDTYIGYYKSGDRVIKESARKVIKKAYIEFQKDYMVVPLKEVIKVAYNNKELRDSLLGMIKKGYAEEEASVMKGEIPPKTWELMIEWHKKTRESKKYPSLREEGREVQFSTYQGYYNSGDNKLKSQAAELVKKLYPDFRKDLEKVQGKGEEDLKKQEDALGKEKSKELKNKRKNIQERRIEEKVKNAVDFMERSVHEIDGELYVKRLELDKEASEVKDKILDRTLKKTADVIQNRMNNVQDYVELEGISKISEKILSTAITGSKKMIETKERWANTAIRGTEWYFMAVGRNFVRSDTISMLDNFHNAEPGDKERYVEKEFNDHNINKKFIDEVELKMFDTIEQDITKIKEIKQKLENEELSAWEKKKAISEIKRTKGKIETNKKYVISEEKKKLEYLVKQAKDEREKKEYETILDALNQSGETMLDGGTYSLKSTDGSVEIEYNLKESYIQFKEKEKESLKKKLGELFDLTQQEKNEGALPISGPNGGVVDNSTAAKRQRKEEAKNKRDEIVAYLINRQSKKEEKAGKYEIEQVVEDSILGGTALSNFIAEMDSYLDSKYTENENKEVRESMTKISKVLVNKAKNIFKKQAIQDESSISSDSQIAQDGMSNQMSNYTETRRLDQIEEKRDQITDVIREITGESMEKSGIIYEAVKNTISGVSDKPLEDFFGESVPETIFDALGNISQIATNHLTDYLLKDNTTGKLAVNFLQEKLNNSSSDLSDLMNEAMKSNPELLEEMNNKIQDSGTLGDLQSFFLEGGTLGDFNSFVSDISKKMSDTLGESVIGKYLENNEGVDFVLDQLGNLTGGVAKTAFMFVAGNVVDSFFEEEYYELFEDPKDRLVQELYNESKTPKELEDKFRKRLQLLQDSLLTDEQWVDKYKDEKVTVVEKGILRHKKKEVPITASLRGVKRKEASSFARKVFDEEGVIYKTLKNNDRYKKLAEKL